MDKENYNWATNKTNHKTRLTYIISNKDETPACLWRHTNCENSGNDLCKECIKVHGRYVNFKEKWARKK